MDQVTITHEQAKALNAALTYLRKNISRRNELIALNNAAAMKSPVHAARLRMGRNAELDAKAEQAIAQVQRILTQNGLGSLGSPMLYAVAIAGSVALGLAALAAIMYTDYQAEREERLYAADSPFLALTRQASTAVWAVLGIGVVGLVGWMYWDYKSNGSGARALSYGARQVPYQRPMYTPAPRRKYPSFDDEFDIRATNMM